MVKWQKYKNKTLKILGLLDEHIGILTVTIVMTIEFQPFLQVTL